jgi:hypothetical protein
MTDKEKEFLIGLTELTKRTGVVISGCGCCGSPNLLEDNNISEESGYVMDVGPCDVAWIYPGDDYWEENKHKLSEYKTNG